MSSAQTPESLPWPPAPVVTVSALVLLVGAGGMAVSFVYLASPLLLDVIAGAAGFLAGAILSAAGLLSLGVLSRSPATTKAATHLAGCLFGVLPPAVAVLGWPIFYLVAGPAVIIFMPLVLIYCLGWAWIQSGTLAGHLSALLGWSRLGLICAAVFAVQAVIILASLPLFVCFMHQLELMGLMPYKDAWS